MNISRRSFTIIGALTLVGALLSMPAFAEDTPQTRATAGGTLRLDTRLSQGWIPIGQPATVYATISIKGQESAQSTQRAPLNVALVLDRSTSMAGGKFAQAISASHTFIDMLGPQDRLSIVSYGSDVTRHAMGVLATPAEKELLHNAVNAIELSGSTNLSGGYEVGAAQVLKDSRDDTVNRVILLSDGHANVGLRTARELGMLAREGLDKGVSLTTIGLGLDYNEDIMTAMAVQGAGNYHFVENGKEIAKVFERECHGLASTVARNTVLELTMAPGVELLDLEGFAFTTKRNTATVKLAGFHSNQQKDILVKLAVSPQATGSLPIITSKLKFDDVTQGDKRVASTATLVAVATDDVKKLAEVDRDVLKRAQQIETARSFDKAMAKFEEGKADEAAKIAAAQRASNSSFQKQYAFEGDDAFGRVDGELQQLEKDVKKAKPSSASGKRMRKAQKSRSYEIMSAEQAF